MEIIGSNALDLHIQPICHQRGQYTSLADNLIWWEGPAFLTENCEMWPEFPGNSELEIENAMSEKLKSQPEITHAMVTQTRVSIKDILELERCSSKGRLVRSFALVLRFIENVKSSVSKRELTKDEIVSGTECKYLETKLIQFIQNEYFKNEIKYLLSNDESHTY